MAHARGDLTAKGTKVALGKALAHLGEHGHRDGHGQYRVGQGVPKPRVVLDGTALLGNGNQRHRRHDRGGHEGAGGDDKRGRADAHGLPQRRVVQVDVEAELDAVAAQARQLHDHLNGHAERVADRQDEEGQRVVRVHQEGKGHERGNGDEVVEDGGGVAPEVVALGIEDARSHAREAVEHNLDREEAEEQHAVGHLRLVGARRLHPDERGGKHKAQNEADAEENQKDREQVGDVVVGTLLAFALANVEVHGQECRNEHATDNELVELVGQVVRHGVAAGEQRGAEGEGLTPGAEEAREAARNDERAHHGGAAANGSLGGLVGGSLSGRYGGLGSVASREAFPGLACALARGSLGPGRHGHNRLARVGLVYKVLVRGVLAHRASSRQMSASVASRKATSASELSLSVRPRRPPEI